MINNIDQQMFEGGHKKVNEAQLKADNVSQSLILWHLSLSGMFELHANFVIVHTGYHAFFSQMTTVCLPWTNIFFVFSLFMS